jgi:hypothetical protein
MRGILRTEQLVEVVGVVMLLLQVLWCCYSRCCGVVTVGVVTAGFVVLLL